MKDLNGWNVCKSPSKKTKKKPVVAPKRTRFSKTEGNKNNNDGSYKKISVQGYFKLISAGYTVAMEDSDWELVDSNRERNIN